MPSMNTCATRAVSLDRFPRRGSDTGGARVRVGLTFACPDLGRGRGGGELRKGGVRSAPRWRGKHMMCGRYVLEIHSDGLMGAYAAPPARDLHWDRGDGL